MVTINISCQPSDLVEYMNLSFLSKFKGEMRDKLVNEVIAEIASRAKKYADFLEDQESKSL